MAWDWEKAWQNLSAAREKNPDLATTNLGFALYYSALGEIELMKKSLYRARDNDSLNLEVADWGNWVLFLTGQIDASREWGNDMMDKHPTIGFVTSDAAIGTYLDGDFKRAVKLAENGRLLDDSPLAKIILAQAYGYAGEKEKVRPLLVEAAQTGVYACPYESAVGYLSIGDVDTAMAMLEQAYQKLSNCLIFLRTDVRLQPIREHPRHRKQYLDLLARVGLDDAKWKSYPR
jgi:tetratricopeptide (TPR) repeat protein